MDQKKQLAGLLAAQQPMQQVHGNPVAAGHLIPQALSDIEVAKNFERFPAAPFAVPPPSPNIARNDGR